MTNILPGFIVGLREGLEAFLIISLILEYLNKLGENKLKGSVKNGLYLGLIVSVLIGLLLWLLSNIISFTSGNLGKLWEVVASFVTVIFITYFIYWMINSGADLVTDLKKSVDSNLSKKGLFILSTVAVAREGAEISLFAFAAEDKVNYLTGNLSGVLVAGILAILIYKSLVRVNIGLIFKITLAYLILQAAYLFGYSLHEFLSYMKDVSILSGDNAIYTKLYNFSGTILDHKKGAIGIGLNVLLGWYSKPEIIQFIAQITYGFTLIAVFVKKSLRK